jgi:hypothetical protein
MRERNAVQRAFDQFGRDAGLEKKSGSWYKRSDEVIAVSNLQRSDYSPRYYINQGFWLQQLGMERFPKYDNCHVWCRLEQLLPASHRRSEELLDLEYAVGDDERLSELVTLLQDGIVPLIEQASSVALCHGWIDGQVRGGDEHSYGQRFTPRRAHSRWSRRNVAIVERLIDEGRMHASGLLEVERAKSDGRSEAAYPVAMLAQGETIYPQARKQP